MKEDTPNKTQENWQRTVDKLNEWLISLDKRITVLLLNDPSMMKPAERERAANRYYMVLLDLLELRMEYMQAIAHERVKERDEGREMVYEDPSRGLKYRLT